MTQNDEFKPQEVFGFWGASFFFCYFIYYSSIVVCYNIICLENHWYNFRRFRVFLHNGIRRRFVIDRKKNSVRVVKCKKKKMLLNISSIKGTLAKLNEKSDDDNDLFYL